KAAHEAMAKTKPSDPIRTGAWIGMQCDTEVARSGFGCRLAETFPQADEAWLTAARVAIRPPLMPADVIGAMPNIVANRLNAEFDLKAPSHVVSAEEGSGLIALDLGVQYLRDSVVDCAIVGAVDMCCEIGHRAAASNVFKVTRQIPGDAAVVLVLKRLADAKRDKDTVYALIADKGEQGDELLTLENSGITRQFGHAHAASGLLHVAAAALKLRENQSDSTAHVMVDSYGGQVFSVCLHSA
ncbi:MAG: pfaBC, partial [Gammaproteobacteria bacterium]|nr:pfaBC [Gammaproteobacteria bacterium]